MSERRANELASSAKLPPSRRIACTRPLDPRIAYIVEQWGDDLRYEFEERAAIIEYDGGTSRWVAEREAYEQTRGERR
jgi:hypothetical protein